MALGSLSQMYDIFATNTILPQELFKLVDSGFKFAYQSRETSTQASVFGELPLLGLDGALQLVH